MFDSPRSENLLSAEQSFAEVRVVLRAEFDQSFYCGRYRDINTDVVDPLEHYCIFGWKEGRDPCPWFSTRRYLQRNRDVVDSGLNPFLHYILVGRQEGRRVWPADLDGPFELDVDPAASFVSAPELRDLIRFPPRPIARQTTPPDPLRLIIHWVIPDFSVGSGGHMTIFRLIRWMEIHGHECAVWIGDPRQHDSADAAYDDVIKYFSTIKGPVAFADNGLADAKGDAIIATGWQTVARVVNAIGFRQRFYLVQDYEPHFHAAGGYAISAAWTYTQDLACICTSPWLTRTLRDKYGRWVRQFWQAFEASIYYPPPPSRDKPALNGRAPATVEVPRIALYARRSSPRRAVELAFLALEYLAAKGVAFHVELFGEEMTENVAPFPCSSHGVLTPERLAELYRGCQLGLCFSATNYSLVPAEMMACGLPVVELDHEATRAVFPDDAVAFTGPHPIEIALCIETLLRDPGRRRSQAEAALRWVR